MSQTVELINGDSIEELPTLAAESIDALVTDPPAGISFMGKTWDHDHGGRDEWIKAFAAIFKECLRVLKPGAHGLVWALPRTAHWTTTALEDAGFEIRDVVAEFYSASDAARAFVEALSIEQVQMLARALEAGAPTVVYQLFGTGFPKSLDVSKAIDKAAGAEREVLGPPPYTRGKTAMRYSKTRDSSFNSEVQPITAPATDDAKKYEGWGTALKPAAEHWILVRKPLDGTVAVNVLKHGTGALNIDASRIGENPGYKYNADKNGTTFHGEQGARIKQTAEKKGAATIESTKGRWPANVVFDEEAAAALDEQSGIRKSGGFSKSYTRGNREGFSGPMSAETKPLRGPSVGGASRFFFVAKPSGKEKDAGLDGADNIHPTCKGTTLMQYLIRLITPPGGTVLDPFLGSGTTGVAAIQLGMSFIGIEKDESYFAIAEKRIDHAGKEAAK